MLEATQPVFETQMNAGGPPVRVTTRCKVTWEGFHAREGAVVPPCEGSCPGSGGMLRSHVPTADRGTLYPFPQHTMM